MIAVSSASFDASFGRISRLCSDGQLREALQLLHQMDQKGISISRDIFYHLLQVCAKKRDLSIARQLQSYRIARDLRSVTVLGDHLIRIFVSCGNLHEANKVFMTVPKPSVYTWNSIISAHITFEEYKRAIELHKQMQHSLTRPNEVTFLYVLKAYSCLNLTEQGMLLHNEITELGLDHDVTIASTLIDMYVKCGNLAEGQILFDSLPSRNIVSWGALVTGYATHGQPSVVFNIYAQLKEKCIQPSKVIYLGILKACSSLGDLEQGRCIHFQMRKHELSSDVIIGTSLIDMYSKCGSLEEAYTVFSELPSRNVRSWSAIINAFIHNDHFKVALELFERMQREGIKLDKVIMSSILKACGNSLSNKHGRILHDVINNNGWALDTVVGSSLIGMYVKFGNLEEALWVFDSLPHKNIVSWGTLMECYVQHEDGLSVLQLFQKMLQEDMKPDSMIFMCVIKACALFESALQGKIIHNHIVYNGLESDVSITSSLVDMYAKCGCSEEACKLFDGLDNPDIISWGSVIAAYALVGNHNMVSQGLSVMLQHGLQPDVVIFTTILTACGHDGLVKEGLDYFRFMRAFQDVKQNVEHYNCIVDILSRAGCLYDAEAILTTMPILPTITGWISLLTSCKTYGDVELGSRCLNEVVKLMPKDGPASVVMPITSTETSENLRTCSGLRMLHGQASIDIDYNMYDDSVGENVV